MLIARYKKWQLNLDVLDCHISPGIVLFCSKTQLKLCVSRVKLLRNKREMTVKQMKKEIAELLKEGKEPSATIRVSNCVNL